MKKLTDYLVVVLIIASTSVASLAYVKHQERMQTQREWIPISQEKIDQLEQLK